MIRNRYGRFSSEQIAETKKSLRKSIYFLLLCVDPKTKYEYEDIDVNKTFDNVLFKISGLNNLLFYPPEIVTIMSLLSRANMEYNSSEMDFTVYRKLILDAGAEVLKIRESDNA